MYSLSLSLCVCVAASVSSCSFLWLHQRLFRGCVVLCEELRTTTASFSLPQAARVDVVLNRTRLLGIVPATVVADVSLRTFVRADRRLLCRVLSVTSDAVSGPVDDALLDAVVDILLDFFPAVFECPLDFGLRGRRLCSISCSSSALIFFFFWIDLFWTPLALLSNACVILAVR